MTTRARTTAAEPTCPKYEPNAGSRRCRHYVANGACDLPDELMCVEWLKANGHVPTKAEPARTSAPPDRTSSHAVNVASLSSFLALGVEVRIASDELGDLWLVPAYTGADRQELSLEHAALLASLCSALPTARITAMVRTARSAAGARRPQ